MKICTNCYLERKVVIDITHDIIEDAIHGKTIELCPTCFTSFNVILSTFIDIVGYVGLAETKKNLDKLILSHQQSVTKTETVDTP